MTTAGTSRARSAVSQDPPGLGPDSNPYRYCGNGPTDGTDPSGEVIVVPEAQAAKTYDYIHATLGWTVGTFLRDTPTGTFSITGGTEPSTFEEHTA